MYNLIVTGDSESWDGEPFILDKKRYLEYTEIDFQNKFSDLSESNIQRIIRMPCIFAYELYCEKDSHFGLIREIQLRKDQIKIYYEIFPIDIFLTMNLMVEKKFDLGIGKLELHRTHWAIKNVDLPRELYRVGIVLPDWAIRSKLSVDITEHEFQVAFSFPGEVRDVVKLITEELEQSIGPNSYFYDNNYRAQLARPSLDLLLQNIYRNRSKLIVVFLCSKYQEKEWCGIEFKAIREIIQEKQHDRIMYVRMDDGKVEGVFKVDGYIDGQTHTPREIAEFIKERIDLLMLN